jgi:hypothetical protein
MFCPECRSLGFITNDIFYCPNHKCGVRIDSKLSLIPKLVISSRCSLYSNQICQTSGCTTSVYDDTRFCSNCRGRGFMMPGKHYRSWPW